MVDELIGVDEHDERSSGSTFLSARAQPSGGLVVDGTGETKARVVDVAIKDGLIVAVGPELSEKGADEIDASGLLVTPGWCAPLPARRAPWSAAAALSAALAVGRSRCRRQRCGRSRLAANAADAG